MALTGHGGEGCPRNVCCELAAPFFRENRVFVAEYHMRRLRPRGQCVERSSLASGVGFLRLRKRQNPGPPQRARRRGWAIERRQNCVRRDPRARSAGSSAGREIHGLRNIVPLLQGLCVHEAFVVRPGVEDNQAVKALRHLGRHDQAVRPAPIIHYDRNFAQVQASNQGLQRLDILIERVPLQIDNLVALAEPDVVRRDDPVPGGS